MLPWPAAGPTTTRARIAPCPPNRVRRNAISVESRDPPPVLVNCDLCILAYQLYHQSALWPVDTTTVSDFERQPELAACMSVFLGDVPKWQKKESLARVQALRAP